MYSQAAMTVDRILRSLAAYNIVTCTAEIDNDGKQLTWWTGTGVQVANEEQGRCLDGTFGSHEPRQGSYGELVLNFHFNCFLLKFCTTNFTPHEKEFI